MHQSSIYLKVTIQFPTIPLSNFIHGVLNDDKFKTKGISNAMSETYMSGELSATPLTTLIQVYLLTIHLNELLVPSNMLVSPRSVVLVRIPLLENLLSWFFMACA